MSSPKAAKESAGHRETVRRRPRIERAPMEQPKARSSHDHHGIARDERGQDQPKDKDRARR